MNASSTSGNISIISSASNHSYGTVGFFMGVSALNGSAYLSNSGNLAFTNVFLITHHAPP